MNLIQERPGVRDMLYHIPQGRDRKRGRFEMTAIKRPCTQIDAEFATARFAQPYAGFYADGAQTYHGGGLEEISAR